MNTTTLLSLRRLCAVLGITVLAAATLQASISDQASDGDIVLSQPGQVVDIYSPVIDSSVSLNANDTALVIQVGQHRINGDLNFNGNNCTLAVEFNKKKESGQLDIAGDLNLGTQNKPALILDMRQVTFAPGEDIVLIKAHSINGQFAGLPNGSEIETDTSKLKIIYDDNVIRLIAQRQSSDNRPSITPVVEFDSSLIDPTSTVPGGMW